MTGGRKERKREGERRKEGGRGKEKSKRGGGITAS